MAKPKRKKRSVHKSVKKSVKRAVKKMIVKRARPVKRIASRDASNVLRETKSVHTALTELTRDVKRIGNLERNVSAMNKKFAGDVQNLNKKLTSTSANLNTSFNNKLGDLSSRMESSIKTLASSVHNKMSQQNEHFNDRMASMHSEMKIANGNASRRMDNIEEAILKMHEAVEALNDNWKDFTHSLMVEEKKR